MVDWIFPKRCVGCGRMGRYICSECEIGICEEEQICPMCGRNSRYGERHKYCAGEMDGLVCHFEYGGLVERIIKEAKYKYYYDELRELVGKCQGLWERPEYCKWMEFVGKKPVIVPVPLHWKREKERGFNQAEIIGKSIVKYTNLDTREVLEKRKDTGHQAGRTRVERLMAMEGAFKINSKLEILSSKSQGQNSLFNSPSLKKEGDSLKRAVLVDDVWTTGATMRECAKVLKKAGVREVWGWVIAR